MALNTTISANGSRGHHRFTLEITETSTNIQNNTSLVSYKFSISPIQTGWNWASWGSQISYKIVLDGTTYTGTIPDYNGSSTITLKSGSQTIKHNDDGSKSISFNFNVTDTTGQNYTCGNASASGSLTLTQLHKSPSISNAIWTETNQSLKTLGVKDDEIVPYMSNKTLKVQYTLYDSATLSQTRLYNQDNSIDTSSTTDTLSLNLTNKTFNYSYDQTSQKYVTDLYISVKDNKNATGTSKFSSYTIIPYFTPNIEQTNSNIRRKTDSSTSLTDNKAVIKLKGSFYKANDVIGNNNTITIQYKVWEDGSSEPTNYQTIINGITITGNDINVEYDIIDINYLKKYHYKLKITDKYNYVSETSGDIPTGVSLWTEYKDRVNFQKITVKDYNPFEYSENETMCGEFLGKPLYRKVLNIGTYTWKNGSNDFRHNISNLDRMVNVDYTMFYPGNSRWYVNWDAIDIENWTCNSSALMITSTGSTTTFNNLTITLEYTKTTD